MARGAGDRSQKVGRARGRFDILCVFDDGAYVRFTSHKTRSLPPAEIVECLRKYAGYIENGLKAQEEAAATKKA